MKENADKGRALDTDEIDKQLRESAEQMFRLRFQMRMGQMEGLKKYGCSERAGADADRAARAEIESGSGGGQAGARRKKRRKRSRPLKSQPAAKSCRESEARAEAEGGQRS